jgi:hypothetical protein
MTTPTGEPREPEHRDVANWARPIERLEVTGVSAGARNLVQGRRLQGPLQGFGKMWQKTYRIRLDGTPVTPADVISTWKERFPEFWPQGNRFYASLTGIKPGEVALISVAAGPMKLSTGVMVLYADDESFTLMTPEGHMFAGWITFSAFNDGEGCVAQVQVLMRAQDPLSELGLALGGHRQEDRFWEMTLVAAAAHFGCEAAPETTAVCVDPRRNWSRARNVWHNAGLRSAAYNLAAPLRWLRRPASQGQ